MLTRTNHFVDLSIINRALENIPSDEFKFTLNRPTGTFFYDSWVIKDEFKNTVWEDLYNTLPLTVGEARLIRLEGGKQYQSHADIDDRYHLNLSGYSCFLIDLDKAQMYSTVKDGVWYQMDAGVRHSAINFGNKYRYQLVIRKLLERGNISNRKKVSIRHSIVDPDDARFYFDDVISPWLNRANKRKVLDNFIFDKGVVSFDIEAKELDSLMPLFNDFFTVEVQ